MEYKKKAVKYNKGKEFSKIKIQQLIEKGLNRLRKY